MPTVWLGRFGVKSNSSFLRRVNVNCRMASPPYWGKGVKCKKSSLYCALPEVWYILPKVDSFLHTTFSHTPFPKMYLRKTCT